MRAYNFWAKGSNLTTFPHDVLRGRYDNLDTHFGCRHAKNLGGQNAYKICYDFAQLWTLITNIFGTDQNIKQTEK